MMSEKNWLQKGIYYHGSKIQRSRIPRADSGHDQNLLVANEVTDRLSSGCDHLISTLDSGELIGAAYTAGKGLFTDIILPSIKKLQAAVDDIQLELTSY